jgi:CRISPR-associated protein Csd1
MILQELNRYYKRKSKQDPNVLAPEGFSKEKVSFLVKLTPEGRLVGLQDIREGEGAKKHGAEILVPARVNRTSEIKSNLLWDNLEYVFGVSASVIQEKIKLWKDEHPEATKDHNVFGECAPSLFPDESNAKHQAFVQRIENLSLDAGAGVMAVFSFLKSDELQKISAESNWPECLKKNSNFAFQLQDDLELICQRQEVRDVVLREIAQTTTSKIFCLIEGKVDFLAELHPFVKGVWGSKPSGGKIISFNEDAFCSQGKEQGANATVGQSSAFRYTTALNHLLRFDSPQRFQIADTSTVFWSAEDTTMEDIFGNVFADDPDRGAEAVKSLLSASYRGSLTLNEGKTRFFILGLAPNAARISVRFWQNSTVAEIAENLGKHFETLQIVHAPQESGFLPIGRLLRNMAVQGKNDNINPRMASELMRSILNGFPYPHSVLHAVIRRIKADQNISFARAALLKAWLNRQIKQTSEKEIKMSLDVENTNQGYRLGRLFAVLEKAQEEAIPGANAGIRDRYYGAASSTPASVYPILLKTYPHHIGKLEVGRKIYFDKLVQNITLELQDFQKVLKLEDQGRFALGYYHQRHVFFTKKPKQDSKPDSVSETPTTEPAHAERSLSN